MRNSSINESEIQEKITRLKRSQVTLEMTSLKEVRLMFGTVSMTMICDEIWPISEIKKEYLRRIHYRIIELQNELIEMKTNQKTKCLQTTSIQRQLR